MKNYVHEFDWIFMLPNWSFVFYFKIFFSLLFWIQLSKQHSLQFFKFKYSNDKYPAAHNQLRLICILPWSPWSSWVSLFISVLKRKVVGNIPRHTASHRKKPARLYRTTMQGRSNCKNTAGQFLGHRLYSTLMFIHKVC